MISEAAIELVAYGSLVALFVVLSAGVASVLFGPAVLPERIRALQLRHGWPGDELPGAGSRRSAGLLFGALVLLLDAVALVGLLATGVVASRPTWPWLAVEFFIVASWVVVLVRSIRRRRTQ